MPRDNLCAMYMHIEGLIVWLGYLIIATYNSFIYYVPDINE